MHTITEPNELTSQQIELINAAAKNRGKLTVCVRSDTRGRAVRGKEEKFYDPNDRDVARQYIEILGQLEGLQLLRQSGDRSTFELTNFGWQISRKLRELTTEG